MGSTMKFTKPTAIALATAPIGAASSYSVRPRYSSSSPVQLFELPSSSVSRMLQKQRAIAQRMFDMVGQQQQQQQQQGAATSTSSSGYYSTHRCELVDNNEEFELTV